MHYRNGREAKNGDKIVKLETSSGKIVAFGVLHSATPGNDFCNGNIAVIQIAFVLGLCSTANAQGWICDGNSCRPIQQAPMVYSPAPVVTARPVFQMSRVNGVHRAYNTVTGANWRWDAFGHSWIYEGNSFAQPAIVEERVTVVSPWRAARCGCGCGCANCRCGK